MEKMNESVLINISLIGSNGLLDKPEEDYIVYSLEDQIDRIKSLLKEYIDKYKNYGFTIIIGGKDEDINC